MTKEQEEAIEILKQDLELAKKEDVIDIDVLTGYLEIALKLIQEQQEENKKKDKIIEEMARAIDNYDSQLVINNFKDKENIKQYFERRVKDES